jgi:hypothetical protein
METMSENKHVHLAGIVARSAEMTVDEGVRAAENTLRAEIIRSPRDEKFTIAYFNVK